MILLVRLVVSYLSEKKYNQKKLFRHFYNSTLVYILELDCIMVRCNTGTRTKGIQEMDYSQR